MRHRFPRILLCVAGVLLVLGAAAHAAAFQHAVTAIAKASNLSAFFANDFKVLWLSDSSTLFILGCFFLLAGARPAVTSPSVVLLLSLVPGATGILIYIFVGNFYAGHLLLIAAIAAFAAGVLYPQAAIPDERLA